MLDPISYKGYWSLTCDDETADSTCSTEINKMLKILSKLQEELPELFPKPPKAIKFYKEFDTLLAYISDNSEEVIKKSAEAIRSNVDFPFIMYYLNKKNSGTKDKKLKYMHTPDGELYKFSYHDSWKLICNGRKPTITCDELLSCQVTDRDYIHLPANEDFKKATNEKGYGRKPTITFDKLLPSRVTDRDYIHLPANEEDFKKATNEKGGKWLLHCSSMKILDNLWKKLTRLYATGVLVALKACTAQFSIKEISPDFHTKVVMCYTANSDCKSCVKRAAQSIFICTGYDFVMYYKSNAASRIGLYRHEGFNRISKYMFTSGGDMFEKDYLNRWKKVVSNEGKHE